MAKNRARSDVPKKWNRPLLFVRDAHERDGSFNYSYGSRLFIIMPDGFLIQDNPHRPARCSVVGAEVDLWENPCWNDSQNGWFNMYEHLGGGRGAYLRMRSYEKKLMIPRADFLGYL